MLKPCFISAQCTGRGREGFKWCAFWLLNSRFWLVSLTLYLELSLLGTCAKFLAAHLIKEERSGVSRVRLGGPDIISGEDLHPRGISSVNPGHSGLRSSMGMEVRSMAPLSWILPSSWPATKTQADTHTTT